MERIVKQFNKIKKAQRLVLNKSISEREWRGMRYHVQVSRCFDASGWLYDMAPLADPKAISHA